MQPSFSASAISGAAIQRFTSVSPAWSADSAKGALLFFGLTFLTAALGALASSSAPSFYGALELPRWAPPAAVFGPVWTFLYAVMAIAAWLVWRHRHMVQGNSGLVLYTVALVPNVLWSWLFFDQHWGMWALIDIGVLWALVGLTVRVFWRVRPLFGLLMVPLWVWVSFAAVLNATLWQANPALLG
ncbi:MAG: TspO/MBR family protein [Rhodoferax sp.]